MNTAISDRKVQSLSFTELSFGFLFIAGLACAAVAMYLSQKNLALVEASLAKTAAPPEIKRAFLGRLGWERLVFGCPRWDPILQGSDASASLQHLFWLTPDCSVEHSTKPADPKSLAVRWIKVR